MSLASINRRLFRVIWPKLALLNQLVNRVEACLRSYWDIDVVRSAVRMRFYNVPGVVTHVAVIYGYGLMHGLIFLFCNSVKICGLDVLFCKDIHGVRLCCCEDLCTRTYFCIKIYYGPRLLFCKDKWDKLFLLQQSSWFFCAVGGFYDSANSLANFSVLT